MHAPRFDGEPKSLIKNKTADFQSNTEIKNYLSKGGLPGICFVRNERDRNELQESQLNLIFDRDLRLVCDTKLPLSSIRNLAQILAESQNLPIHWVDLARRTRISQPTIKKIISGLESVFFLRVVLCRGDETHPVFFLEDQGDASHLAQTPFDSVQNLRKAFPGAKSVYLHPGKDIEILNSDEISLPITCMV